jgi:uncharacterized protein (TIGR03790 family)
MAWDSPRSDRVLVVFNARNADSRKIATHYMNVRGIAAANSCALRFPSSLPDAESEIPWSEYSSLIQQPIRKCVETAGVDKILYIVFTYGTPYRFNPVPQPEWGRSIDQYVADLWDESGGDMRTRNSYFSPGQAKAARYQRFQTLAEYRLQPGAKRIYSVWRLDAPTPKLAGELVDKAMQAEKTGVKGQACFDRVHGDITQLPEAGQGVAEWQLHRAADAARQAGFPVLEDENSAEFGTAPAPLRCENAILYCGWYSLNHYNDAFSWAPGAIGWHLDSASAMSRVGPNWSAQALAKGITITSGAVSEPYLDALVRADGVVLDLFQGANVGDAFLRNTAYLKWMIINLGDPLYTPFPNGRAPFNAPEKR